MRLVYEPKFGVIPVHLISSVILRIAARRINRLTNLREKWSYGKIKTNIHATEELVWPRNQQILPKHPAPSNLLVPLPCRDIRSRGRAGRGTVPEGLKGVCVILVIGEILFDVFPSYRRIGGAPFNVAFHLKKLGCTVRFISRVGRDEQGEEIGRFLSHHGFDTKDLQVDTDAPTGRVNVLPDHGGGHRFEILENRAFDAIEYTPGLEELLASSPELICFGTLAQRSPEGTSLMARVMDAKNEKTKAFCDLNLRENCYSQKTIGASLQWSDRIKLNREELFTLFPGTVESSATTLVHSLMADYRLETVILTSGANGSEWFSPHTSHQIRPSSHLSVMDTVGAGDAFAAMAVACMTKKIPAAKAITLAHAFASSICTIKGALPASDDFYSDYRKTMEAYDGG